jgi:hypothetical protein
MNNNISVISGASILSRKLRKVTKSLDLNPAINHDYYSALKEINDCLHFLEHGMAHSEFESRIRHIDEKLSRLDTVTSLLDSVDTEDILDYLRYHLGMELSEDQEEFLSQ